MKTLLSLTKGPPESLVLLDREEPVAGAIEVLIRVAACGINYPDTLIIEDRYQYKPERPFAPGAEISGTIEALGLGVEGLSVGDRVLGYGTFGGLAEKAVLPAERCFRVAPEMQMQEAAAFVMTYGTAYHALKDRARMQSGETLLVLGASGGVGLAAVEIGKAMGARVLAAVSSEDKAAVARGRGADATILYPIDSNMGRETARQLSQEFREAFGGGIDVVLDGVGGGYAEPALRTMAWDGRYLVVGFPAGIPTIPLNIPLLKGCVIVGVFWGSFIDKFPHENRRNVGELMEMYRAGQLRPLVSRTFPLHRGGEAIALLASRRSVGKIVVTMP